MGRERLRVIIKRTYVGRPHDNIMFLLFIFSLLSITNQSASGFVNTNIIMKNGKPRHFNHHVTSTFSRKFNDDWNGDAKVEELKKFQEAQTKKSLIQALLQLDSEVDLVHVKLAGKIGFPTSSKKGGFSMDNSDNNYTTTLLPCAVLVVASLAGISEETSTDPLPALCLPLDGTIGGSESQWKLLEFTRNAHLPNDEWKNNTTTMNNNNNNNNGMMISKIALLGLNAALINRDGGLFDNLPYSTWTVDPDMTMRDAANNPVNSKYNMGKRRAYNWLLTGKDWYSSSSKGNNNNNQNNAMASRVGQELLQDAVDNQNVQPTPSLSESDQTDDSSSINTLTRRILELKLKELEMDIADWDYQIAIARNNQNEFLELKLEGQKEASLLEIKDTRQRLEQLLRQPQQTPVKPTSRPPTESIKDDIDSKGTDQKNLGLSSIAPWLSGILESINPSSQKKDDKDMKNVEREKIMSSPGNHFLSPYDMMRQIIRKQLNAEVIGAVLENTSLLDGTITLGGAIVLRRLTPQKIVTLAGEQVAIRDEEETYGNDGIQGGETILVECKADEAIGMSLACGDDEAPLWIESNVWEQGSIMVKPKNPSKDLDKKSMMVDWEPVDPELSVLMEGQASNQSATERVAPVRVPRTSLSLFDSLFDKTETTQSQQLFPTDNPIKSLSQYDKLTSEDKARTLMSMSNFEGKLPRPRELRTSSNEVTTALDDLLLPLIDESVRNQFLIRDALNRGDMDRVEQLEQSKSRRQFAKEKAEQARRSGNEDEAKRWEAEADLYEGLRADVTQDEGSYSRFLDRDEWYERQRQQQAKRVDRSKFGNLLDGIE